MRLVVALLLLAAISGCEACRVPEAGCTATTTVDGIQKYKRCTANYFYQSLPGNRKTMSLLLSRGV